MRLSILCPFASAYLFDSQSHTLCLGLNSFTLGDPHWLNRFRLWNIKSKTSIIATVETDKN